MLYIEYEYELLQSEVERRNTRACRTLVTYYLKGLIRAMIFHSSQKKQNDLRIRIQKLKTSSSYAKFKDERRHGLTPELRHLASYHVYIYITHHEMFAARGPSLNKLETLCIYIQISLHVLYIYTAFLSNQIVDLFSFCFYLTLNRVRCISRLENKRMRWRPCPFDVSNNNTNGPGERWE